METVRQELIQNTCQSLLSAEENIDNILQTICKKKWEQEVVEKKGKSHSINWVFSQGESVQILKPDPNLVNTQFDQDEEDEPVSSC